MPGKRSNPDRRLVGSERRGKSRGVAGGSERLTAALRGCQFRPVMRIALRVAAALMAIFFVYAAVVQLNDPDPVRWIAIYVAALGCSVGCAFAWRVRALSVATAVAGAAWAVGWWTILAKLPQFGKIPWIEIEEARELGGLLIVTAWTALVAAIGDARR